MALLAGHADAILRLTRVLVVTMGHPNLMPFVREGRPRRVMGLLLGCVLAVGCRKAEPKESPAAPMATAEPGTATVPDRPAVATPSEAITTPEAGLAKLAGDHSNPYLANNARAALEAWNRRDYDQTVVYLQTILNLRLTPDQQSQAMAALGGIRDGLDRAAQGGNGSAKAALTRLSTMSAP